MAQFPAAREFQVEERAVCNSTVRTKESPFSRQPNYRYAMDPAPAFRERPAGSRRVWLFTLYLASGIGIFQALSLRVSGPYTGLYEP